MGWAAGRLVGRFVEARSPRPKKPKIKVHGQRTKKRKTRQEGGRETSTSLLLIGEPVLYDSMSGINARECTTPVYGNTRTEKSADL